MTALLADVDDAEALAGARPARARRRRSCARSLRAAGRPTAEAYAYAALDAALGGAARRVRRTVAAERRPGRPLYRARRALGAAPDDAARRLPGFASRTASTACPRRASPSPAVRRSSRSSPQRFPNRPVDFTLLYLGSSCAAARPAAAALARAPAPGMPVVLNQDGVGYPGWAGARTEAVNRPLRGALLARRPRPLPDASSASARPTSSSASRRGSWEILPNAVDVERFTPAPSAAAGGPVLLLGGDQTQAYRLELGLRTLAAVLPAHPDARLLVDRASRLGSRAAHRRARSARSRRARRPLRAERGARALPPRAPAAAHEGERPLPERRARGDGLRAAGRPPRERRHGRAGRRTRPGSAFRTRTRSSGTSRPRRRPWPTPSTGCSAERRRSPPPRGGARSSAIRWPRGSTGTRSCSPSWWAQRVIGYGRFADRPGSRGLGRRASPRGNGRAGRRGGRPRRARRPSGRASMRATVCARIPVLAEDVADRCRPRGRRSPDGATAARARG